MAKGDPQPRSSPPSIPPVAPEALVGQVLDERYRIDAAVGVGGMGAVYRSTHLKLGSQVAIKLLLRQHASSPALRKRFEREAKALAALAHPSIVTVTDYGVSGDTPYLVMELLEGEPLSKRLPNAPFSGSQVLELTQQLLRALSFVHERGLVHRDLKPANVFLQRLPDGEERVKLLDFGLAKFVQGEGTPSDPHLTPAGEAVGTPAYMPPEQIAGGPPDARTDVYALGVIVFQMLSGRLPFEGEPLEQLKAHLLSPVPSLSAAHPTGKARPELEALLQRAMAKQPAARFQDAAEMLAALDAIPQPWILPKDAADDSDALGVAPTLVHPGRTSEPRAANEPAAVQPASTSAAPASPEAPPRRSKPSSVPAPKRQVRVLFVALLMLVTATAAGLFAIARDERNLKHRVLTPPARANAEGPGAAADTASTAQPGRRNEASATPALGVTPDEALPAGDAAVASLDGGALVLEADAHEREAPQAGARPRPAAPRPPARNPWTRGTPKELRTLRKVVESGGFGRDHGIALLRKYSHTYPDDPRGHLLLARLYINRHWRGDAVGQYAAAWQADPSSRGAPQMLSDLLGVVASGSNADDAARLIVRAYGREAVPAIDRALASTRRDSPASRRLRALRARIAGQ